MQLGIGWKEEDGGRGRRGWGRSGGAAVPAAVGGGAAGAGVGREDSVGNGGSAGKGGFGGASGKGMDVLWGGGWRVG